MKRSMSSGVKPATSSDYLGWFDTKITHWKNISPSLAYDSSMHSKHVITISDSPEPVRLHIYG